MQPGSLAPGGYAPAYASAKGFKVPESKTKFVASGIAGGHGPFLPGQGRGEAKDTVGHFSADPFSKIYLILGRFLGTPDFEINQRISCLWSLNRLDN